MERAEKLYTCAVLAETAVLFANGAASLVWLWRLETEGRADELRRMFLAALLISCALIPVETAIFRAYRKRRAPAKRSAQTRLARIVLPKLPFIVGALWLIHGAMVETLAARYGWRHGGDLYMFHSRPGSRIILLSLAGANIPWLAVNSGEDR